MYEGRDIMSPNLEQFRIDLHQIPETSYTEFKTQSYLRHTLENMGYHPVDIASTGLYVYIDNQQPQTIALRTDIDALPVFEQTGLPFASTHPGFMHACGHDGHMAMMLGVADYLKDKQSTLKKNVLLLFQPAEESTGGAKRIVDTNIFSLYNVQAIFGIHLYPEIKEGVLTSKPNECMAMVNEIDIIVHGKSAHGAMPQDGIDANIIVSKLLLDFEKIQSRMVSPLDSTILTFGVIKGGSVRNQISDFATLQGTIRSFNEQIHQHMISQIKTFAKGYEELYYCKIEVIIKDGYPPVINDPLLYQTFLHAIDGIPYQELPKPLMIAEDFSFYQKVVPGVFFFLGTKNIERHYTYSLHHPQFNFSHSVLEVGLKAYQKILYTLGVYHE